MRYRPGDFLFREGSPAESLFLLTTGRIRLERIGFGVEPVTVDDIGAPAVLGSVGLFDGGANEVSAPALLETEADVVPRHQFLEFCREHGELAVACLATFARQMRDLSEYIDLTRAATVRQRLARFLLRCFEQQRSARVVLDLSQSQLALRLDTVREIIWRSMRGLESARIVRFQGREVTLLDPVALRVLASGEAQSAVAATRLPMCGYFRL
jgi:CRP/FNR family transcriptional regulator